MKKKVLWANDDKELLQLLEEAMSKYYEKQMEVVEWLNKQSLQVEVWKN